MFVLDASVALRWLLDDAGAADRKYGEVVMEALALTLTPPSNTPRGKPHGTRLSAILPKLVCI